MFRQFKFQSRPYLIAASLSAFFCVLSAAMATGLKSDKLPAIESAITNAIAEKKMPGAVFWLERQGALFAKAFGNRMIEPRVDPMTAETVFDIASLTKVVATAPAIARLMEKGQVEIEKPVRHYLPEFQGDPEGTITVRHLLTHTSGLRPGLSRAERWEGYDAGIRLACAETTTNTPGTTFRYSDINFILLGEIVHRASGQPLDQFASTEIFRPLKMRSTEFRPLPMDRVNIAPTQRSEEGLLRGVVHDPTSRRMGGVAGHAGLFSTAADLARFARMLLNRGELEGVRLFHAETIDQMTRVQSPREVRARRGLGWDIDSAYSRPRGGFPLGSYGHTGWTGCCLWIDPYSHTFFIFLSNRVHPDGKGEVVSLYSILGSLSAEAVDGFDFSAEGLTEVVGTNLLQSTSISTNQAVVLPPLPGEAEIVPASTNYLVEPRVTSGRLAPTREVLTGIDVLVKQNFAPLKRLRIGLVTNHTGTDRQRNPTIDLLYNAPDVQLKALFSPEHGIRGAVDAAVDDTLDAKTGLKVYSLYPNIPPRETGQSESDYQAMALRLRSPSAGQLTNLDALVFDIQDIGCRFYTYISTLGNCIEAAGRAHLRIFVLDRPNPINGLTLEGPVYQGSPAFVAYHGIPLRHGMTVGELARMFNTERSFQAKLTVIPMESWTRDLWFDQTSLGWTHPSPNMRSLPAATLYPGLGLLESALSVGRGTDRPFEQVGAPYANDLAVASALNAAALEGVRFIPIRFTPVSSTFANKSCAGVAIIVTDRARCQPVEMGLEIALTWQRLYPKEFDWKKIGPLLRDQKVLDGIRAGTPRASLVSSWATDLDEFGKRRRPFLIYP